MKYLPLVKSLVGGNSHHDLVSDSQEKKTTLWQVQGHLADNLVEALGKELLSDRANAALTGLALHQLLIEHLSETSHIDSGGGLVAHVLDPVLATFDPLSRRKDGVEDVFLLWFVLNRGHNSLSF